MGVKIALVITMHNEAESGYAEIQLDNALEMKCFDDIFVLDDGSDDNTWDILQLFSKKYNNIHIYRNEKNSILSNGENRWVTIMREVSGFNPDWIQIRAADVIHSFNSSPIIKSKLNEFLDTKINVVITPWINLWRSNYWYRVDGTFKTWVDGKSINTIWRFNKNYKYGFHQQKAGYHQGNHLPQDLGFGAVRQCNINVGLNKPWPVVKIHLSFVSQYRIVDWFRSAMFYASSAYKNGRLLSMPPPELMPEVLSWKKYSTYFVLYEFDSILVRTPQIWHKESIQNEKAPIPESLYEVIKEFNTTRAEEYKVLFDKTYGDS